MGLSLTRTSRNLRATFGELRLEREILTVTIENTALIIPAGVFPVTLDYSLKFQMLIPRLHEVPGRTDIEIHHGNYDTDTRGCIVVGRYISGEAEVAESRRALGIVLARWREWHDGTITVKEA